MKNGSQCGPSVTGSRLDADHPENGVLIPCRNTRKTQNLGFVPYMNKLIKLPKLLRENRAHLPQLLLVLDRTEPLDIMLLVRLKMSAQEGRLIVRPIERKQKNSS